MFRCFWTIFSLGASELQIIHRVFMTAFNSVDQLQSALNGKKSNAAIATDLKTSLTLVWTTTYSEKVSRKNALSENSWLPITGTLAKLEQSWFPLDFLVTFTVILPLVLNSSPRYGSNLPLTRGNFFPFRSFPYTILSSITRNHVISAWQVRKKSVYWNPKHWIYFKTLSLLFCHSNSNSESIPE